MFPLTFLWLLQWKFCLKSSLVPKRRTFLARCSFSPLQILLSRVMIVVLQKEKSSFWHVWDVPPMLAGSFKHRWALINYRSSLPHTYLTRTGKNHLMASLIITKQSQNIPWGTQFAYKVCLIHKKIKCNLGILVYLSFLILIEFGVVIYSSLPASFI